MKRWMLAVTVITAVMMLSGCGDSSQKEMLKPYEASYEMANALTVSGETGKADFFAQDLCVVTGEDAYVDDLIDAGAAIIFNRTDKEVVFSNDAYAQLYPASITKLLTVLVALEQGDLNATIEITGEMLEGLEGTSSANLQPGEIYTLEQLMYGAMLPSGNDAATAIAYLVGGGSVDTFVAMMNDTAQELGATGSHFMNPHGLSHDDHYVTAYDIYLIVNRLLDYELFSQIISTPTYTADYTKADGTSGQREFNTTIRYTSGSEEAPEGVTPVGGKTGTTTPAQSCLAMVANDAAGKQYIAVILKAPNRDSLYDQMNELFTKILK